MKLKRCINTGKFDGGVLTLNDLGQVVPVKKNVRKLSVADLWNIQSHRRNYLPHSGLAL